MNSLKLFSALIENINNSCDLVEANHSIVKSHIAAIKKENNRISESIDTLENLFLSKNSCEIIPFGTPNYLYTKNNKPTLHYNLNIK